MDASSFLLLPTMSADKLYTDDDDHRALTDSPAALSQWSFTPARSASIDIDIDAVRRARSHQPGTRLLRAGAPHTPIAQHAIGNVRPAAADMRYHHHSLASSRPRMSLSERLQVLNAPPPPPQHDYDAARDRGVHTAQDRVHTAHPRPPRPTPGETSDVALATTPRSRSASITSSADAAGTRMQGVMMEAMKTIQRYDADAAIQKTEIERLTALVAQLEREKAALSARVQRVKDASLQTLAASSKSLETLREDLAVLKAGAQAFTPVSRADMQEIKDTIAHALSASAQYLTHTVKEGEKTREVITELKLDCMNKQQVLDMLRDRLADALADLATSKNRVLELEEAYAADKLELKHACGQLTATGSHIAKLASALKEQQKESLDAVALAGSLEQQLHASQAEHTRLEKLVGEFRGRAADASSLESRVFHLQSLVDEQHEKLRAFDKVNEEKIQLLLVVKEKDERTRVLEEDLLRLNSVATRNTKLETLLEEREEAHKADDAELAKLSTTRDTAVSQIVQLTTQLHDSDTKSKLLESELLTKSQHLDEFKTIVRKLQENLDANHESIKKLQTELASSCAREAASRMTAASEKTQRLEEASIATVNALQLTEVKEQLRGVLSEVESCKKRLEDANVRSKSLQERFEEQSITLRLTRDTSAELQDRLIAAESNYAKDLEAKCGNLCTQIAVLQEQNIMLRNTQAQFESDTKAQRKQYEAKEAALIERIEAAVRNSEVDCRDLHVKLAVLQEQNAASQAQLDEGASTLQVYRVESAKKEAELVRRVEDSRKDLDREILRASEMKSQMERELAEMIRQKGDLATRLDGAQEQLQVVPAPCETHEEEIERLNAKVSRVSAESDAMKKRMLSLNDRYNKGDLDPEERLLIKTIIRATQSTHDHELAQLQNELNRNSKLIGNLQEAKTMLENSLAKHLAAEAKLQKTAANTGTSIIECVNWPSSQADASMDDCVPPAQDQDEPSTAPEDPQNNGGVLPAFDPIQAPNSPYRPQTNVLRHSTPGSNVNFAPPSAGAGKPYFSTLASLQSDEIVDFDEETPETKRKKIQAVKTDKVLGPASKPAKRTKTTKLSETEQTQFSGEPATIKTTYKKALKEETEFETTPPAGNSMPRQLAHTTESQASQHQDEPAEGMEEEPVEQQGEGYASSTPTSSLTWITWFCSLPGHEYFSEVSEDFIEDDFNLTGLNSMVPFWKEAMEMVLDVEPEEDSLKIPDVSIVEASAELLYGLVHQRYILTRAGLAAMVEKYEAGQFGTCPRVLCAGSYVAPCGRSDLPGLETVKLYCPNCNDIYTPPSSRFQGVDGAFFGTTFPNLFFQTYRELAPAPYYNPTGTISSWSPSRSPARTPAAGSTPALDSRPAFVNPNPHGGQKRPAGQVYTPKIYGFRVSERARSGPRMRWLRLRPETAAELDMVDWRGRWIGNEGEYEDDEEEGEGAPMEDFDPDHDGEDEEDEEDEEEEEEAAAMAETMYATVGSTVRVR